MLYHLIYPLHDYLSGLNIFRYITFRSALAALFCLLLFIFFGKSFIEIVKSKSKTIIRKLTPESHKKKMGTPSMGGIFIVGTVVLATIFASDLLNPNIILLLITLIGFALLGFTDDYIKEARKDGRGIASRVKLIGQIVLALSISCYLYFSPSNQYFLSGNVSIPLSVSTITMPFFTEYTIDLGIFYIPFAMLIIISSSNAVNITDGLDGLAIVLSLLVFMTFFIITYMTGHQFIAEYLKIPFSPQVGEISVFLAALCGACLGFFWFNSHPAQIFMGDTGSLALGGIIAVVALILKKELLLPIIGGVFVMETLSVIIQVGYYKLHGRRIFRMAPIHHHFELKGWPENKVITRFWILGAILAIISLASFKIR